MPDFQNREEFNKLQEEADKIRNTDLAKLTPKEKKKFDAIDQAIKLLSDNNIPFYLFPILPHSESQGRGICYQYNNLAGFVKSVDGKPTKTSSLWLSWFNHSFYYSLVNFLQGVKNKGVFVPPVFEDFTEMGNTLYLIYNDYKFWSQTGHPPKKIIDTVADLPDEPEETL
jgi:hypothetical protein